jgi:hypothetical protein
MVHSIFSSLGQGGGEREQKSLNNLDCTVSHVPLFLNTKGTSFFNMTIQG